MSNQVSDSKSVSKKNTLPQFIQNPIRIRRRAKIRG